MFCRFCGKQIPDNAKFCPKCGKSLTPPAPAAAPQPDPVPAPQPAPDPAPQPAVVSAPQSTPAPQPEAPRPEASQPTPAPQLEAPQPEAAPAPTYTGEGESAAPQPAAEPAPAKKSRRAPLIIALCLALLAFIAAGGFGVLYFLNSRAYSKELEAGGSYLDDGEYQDAILAYQAALEKKPGDVRASLGLARAYLCDGRQNMAKGVLSDLQLSESDPQYEEYAKLLALSRLELEVEDVDVSAFPTITVSLGSMGDIALSPDQFILLENGETREIDSVETVSGGAQLVYFAEDTENSDEARKFDLTFTTDKIAFQTNGSYRTPHFEPANLTLVSSDVSAYPLVRLYFRAETVSGETIPGLTKNSFVIRERLQGGEYLSREVHSVAPLEGNAGLNIDLVADKSDSISTTDMGKIKNVMKQFVNSLHYEVGDRAEVLAFDTVVQQMCSYTNNASLLVNGIDNMSTDGMTALYDAIYDGTTHAALQGGARCVIAFTDGMDNRSRHSVNEVISYANAKQVPVYIIGVGGSVEASTLRTIAASTGGRYWYIDDLYDLEEIFNQIYTEQKELYVVEYESDSSLDSYATRQVDVSVSGGGYRTSADMSFTPVRSINDGGASHTSRYELIRESLSWEEASQRCQEMGGHLATITSQDEMDQLVQMAEAAGVKYVWLGGTTSHDDAGNVFGHWVTGEDFTYQAWSDGEPSRVDLDGTEEWYIMLWNIPSLGGWTWNDQRNDPAAAVAAMAKDMAFICEFES